jgi:hypothetical protein
MPSNVKAVCLVYSCIYAHIFLGNYIYIYKYIYIYIYLYLSVFLSVICLVDSAVCLLYSCTHAYIFPCNCHVASFAHIDKGISISTSYLTSTIPARFIRPCEIQAPFFTSDFPAKVFALYGICAHTFTRECAFLSGTCLLILRCLSTFCSM